MTDDPTKTLLDSTGGTAMHRDRDARQEAKFRVSDTTDKVEYDEELLIPRALLTKVDMNHLRQAGWIPLALDDGVVTVAAVPPVPPGLDEEIRATLDARAVRYHPMDAADLEHAIANNLDVNPGFPASANRTMLAEVRNHLASRRSMLSSRRTMFARGRTGLSMVRTGLTFITIILLLLRSFGLGWSSPVEAALLAAGLFLMADGMRWYLPARRLSRRKLERALPPLEHGLAVLQATIENYRPVFSRTGTVPGAQEMLDNWGTLSPVMRRRMLALERTDLAEGRTLLAYHRTRMAMARTGLALGRTGVALGGIGVALVRQFHQHAAWDAVGWSLLVLGVVMTLEGLLWSFPGRAHGRQSARAVDMGAQRRTAWSLVLPPEPEIPDLGRKRPRPTFPAPGRPGIWGSTGLALERTLLAERRNVMARLRTHMARCRTGLACIRTGMNFIAVGTALLVAFGLHHPVWDGLELAVLGLGLALTGDGLRWRFSAERVRRGLPYCVTPMDITLPDYTQPVSDWPTAVFNDHAR